MLHLFPAKPALSSLSHGISFTKLLNNIMTCFLIIVSFMTRLSLFFVWTLSRWRHSSKWMVAWSRCIPHKGFSCYKIWERKFFRIFDTLVSEEILVTGGYFNFLHHIVYINIETSTHLVGIRSYAKRRENAATIVFIFLSLRFHTKWKRMNNDSIVITLVHFH